MAESLSLAVVVKLIGELTQTSDLSTQLVDKLDKDYTKLFASGTGANQANMLWHDQRTLGASATENLDLAGSLLNSFGTTVTFTRIKGILIAAASANTNDVQVTRPAATGVTVFLAASDGLSVRPGGLFLWVAPDATAIAIGAGSSDLLTLTNSGGTTSVTYDVYLMGTV